MAQYYNNDLPGTTVDFANPAGIDVATDNPPQGIDLYVDSGSPVSDSVATHRAQKYNYALKNTSPGEDTLKYDVLSGSEAHQRQAQQHMRLIDEENLKIKMVQEYMLQDGEKDPAFVQALSNATSEELQNPETLYEKLYGRRLIDDVSMADAEETDLKTPDGTVIAQDSILQDALNEDFEGTQKVMEVSSQIKARQELVLKEFQDINGRWDQAGYGATISNYLEQFVPGFSWWNLSSSDNSNLLLGNDMAQQYEDLYSLPVDEFHAAVKQRAAELEAANPLDAMVWLQGLISFTGTDQFLNNAVSVLDATTPLPIVGVLPAKAYVRAGTAVARLAQTTKAAIKSSNQAVTRPAQVMAATGNVNQAAQIVVAKELQRRAAATGSVQTLDETLEKTTTMSNPSTFVQDIGNYSREKADRILATIEADSERLLNEGFVSNIQVSRLGDQSEQAALDQTARLLNYNYGQGSDIVIDIKPVGPADVRFANVNTADVIVGGNEKIKQQLLGNAGGDETNVIIGKKDATFFDSEAQAKLANDMFYGFHNAEVIDVGGKFALQVKMPVSEISEATRDALRVETKNAAQPESLATILMPYLRSSKALVDKNIGARMDMALMGGQQLSHVAQKVLEPVGKLSEREWDELNRFMNWERDLEPVQGQRGYFAPTLGQFQRDFSSLHKTLPSEKQTDAYVKLRTINDWGYAVTNAGILRDKSRQGRQLFSFGRATAQRPSIEGKLAKFEDMFASPENAGIVIMDDVAHGQGQVVYTKYMGSTSKSTGQKMPTKKELEEMIASGQYKIVQLSNQGERAFLDSFPDINSRMVNFVISKNVQSSPLDLQQLPYRAGWHVELDDGVYISQASIKKSNLDNAPLTVYYGDRNAYHFVDQKKANEFIKNFEGARQLLAAGKINELKIYLKSKQGLPHTPREFLKMFKDEKKGGGGFDVKQPFYVRSKNQSLEKQYKLSALPENSNWVNKKDSAYNLDRGGVNLNWATERGDHIYTVVNEGDTVNPAWKYKPAKHVDAMTTTMRAANGAARGRYLDDFKHSMAERFMVHYGDVIAHSADDLRVNPYMAISNPSWVEGANPAKVAQAKAARQAIANFLGMKNEHGRHADLIKAKIWQSMLDKFGEKGAYDKMKTLDWLDGWSFGAIKDPVKAMRGLAFTQKMGFFNPAQLLLQAQTMVHTLGVAGLEHGAKGYAATWAHRAAMMAPQHADWIFKKFAPGWSAADARESFDWAQRSGWYRIGREVAVLDDYTESVGFAPGMRGKISGLADKSAVFFREGERWTRMAAWNAAFSEWKAANPGKAFNGMSAQTVLARANLMTVDMLASSNAAWQKGVLGIPTQFWAYQSRLMEQLWGNRLTAAEKVRVTAAYSLIYGIPVAGGAWAGFWPIHETVREWSLQNGYEPEGPLSFLDKGIGNVASELITGTEFSVSERFGPGGLPFIEDILSGDETLVEAIGGVSGTTIGENMKALYPFAYSVYSLFNPQSELYPVTTHDILDLARTTSTGNSVYNILAAYNLINAATKNGVPTDRLEGWESLIALFGPSPSRISDAYRILENEKERTAFEKKGIDEASKELRRSLDLNLSVEDRNAHSKRAHHIMHYKYNMSSDQISQVVRKAMDNKSVVEEIGRRAAEEMPQYREWFAKQQIDRMERNQ